MPYPYEQIFAADESSPEKVASNGVVTIFAPGDPDRTPLNITTLDGLPLSNPIQVNDAGFGPAFMHATLDQVAWAGGGFSGLFVSYQGMKDEAVAARRAAEEAAQDAGAPTDAMVDRGIKRANIPNLVAETVAADGTVAEAASVAVAAEVEAQDLMAGSDERIPQYSTTRPGWDHIEIDSDGFIVQGLKTDGTVYVRSFESPGLLASTDERIPQPFSSISSWDHVETDSNDEVIAGRRTDGSYYFRSISSPSLSDLPTSVLPNKVAGFGDSMLADHGGLGATTLSALAGALGGDVDVYSGGVPGQTSTEVALRQGGLDVFLTVTGNTIPESGAVAVSAVQPSGTWKTGSTWNFTGTLGGVVGILNKSPADAWVFTRSTPGVSVKVKPETRWVSTEGAARRDWVQIWRCGRNNVQGSIIARDEKAMRAGLASNNNRFLVLPTYNATTEPAGSSGYANIMAINATRAETFGPNYYDMRGWIIRHGLAEAGINPTVLDTDAIAEDRIPPSLMHDAVHLNVAGRTVEGMRLAHILKAKGLIS